MWNSVCIKWEKHKSYLKHNIMESNNSSNTPNQNPDEHIKPLSGKEAIAKLRELAKAAETCFFCTNIKTGLPLTAAPMDVADVDEEGNLWFVSKKDSTRNHEIEADPFTHLFFQGSKHSGFLNVYGISEISFDKSKIEELWQSLHAVWFPEGKDDPTISLIKVVPTQSYYWDTKHGELVAFAKMAVSLVTGKTMDDSVEGELDV
jgi:general stress protein 26